MSTPTEKMVRQRLCEFVRKHSGRANSYCDVTLRGFEEERGLDDYAKELSGDPGIEPYISERALFALVRELECIVFECMGRR